MKKFNILVCAILALACLVNANMFGMEDPMEGPSGESTVESTSEGFADLRVSTPEEPTGMVKLITIKKLIAEDGTEREVSKTIEVQKSIAYESQTIKDMLAGIPHTEESKTQEVTLRFVNGAVLQQIIGILTAIKQIQPYFTAEQYVAAKLEPFVTPRQIQPVVNAILKELTPKQVGALAQAEDFLDIPVLRNALANYMADVLVKSKPAWVNRYSAEIRFEVEQKQVRIREDKLAGVVRLAFSFEPRMILLDIHKHIMWRKGSGRSGVVQERCIADLIYKDGHPKIKQNSRGYLELKLAEKNLTSLDGLQLMQGLDSVQKLDVCQNYLQVLPENIFKDLKNLNELSCGFFNQIHTIQPGAFNGLVHLRSLYLGRNRLRFLQSGVFNGLDNLQHLSLDNNELQTIQPDVFNGLENLQKLVLCNNKLQLLPANLFNGLGNLQELNLAGNQLDTIQSDTFDSLVNLQSLILRYNPFQTLPIILFNGLASLQELKLSYDNAQYGLSLGGLPSATIAQIQQALPHIDVQVVSGELDF